MHTIALFRGINVGGRNIIPMKELKTLCEEIGLKDVRTYIQSGNVVFRTDERDLTSLVKHLTSSIRATCGFEPYIILIGREKLEKAVANNPFPEAESEPANLHVFFLDSPPANADVETLKKLGTTERFLLADDIFYLHAPDGIGRSKLVANIEKCLGVPATGRNWRTVMQLMAMVS